MALNRFLFTYDSKLYKLFFGNKSLTLFWLFSYDLFLFIIFYVSYILTSTSFFKPSILPSSSYYFITISTITIANLTSLLLMIFVLQQIYSSMKLIASLDQKKMLKERKKIAWIIIFQCVINFLLTCSRVVAFYNVSLSFNNGPTIMCFDPFGNFYNFFSYAIIELLVCVDCIIYLFVLTPYREQLFKFVKTVTQRYKVHVLMVSSVQISGNIGIVHGS